MWIAGCVVGGENTSHADELTKINDIDMVFVYTDILVLVDYYALERLTSVHAR